MQNNSCIQTILNAFSFMDISILRNQLKEEYSYEDTSKEIFLKEIDKIFRRHKKSEGIKLFIYEGKCTDITFPGYGKRGYRFIGNCSRNYFDLIFDTENDDIIYSFL
jgi:hypothetical protein